MMVNQRHDYDAVLDDWAAQVPTMSIVEKHSMNVQTLHAIIKKLRGRGDPRASITRTARRPAQRKIDREALLEFYAANRNLPVTTICKTFNASESQVRQILAGARKAGDVRARARSSAPRRAAGAVAPNAHIPPARPDVVRRNGVSLPRVPCIDGPAPACL